MQISGSRALLTGASGGLGHAIARRLHAAGARLVLTGRRIEVLEPLAAELEAEAVAVDLAARAELEGLIERSRDVDLLIANAALPASGRLESFSVAELDRALDVNLRAVLLIAHELAPRMVERGRGQIVVMSSLAGKSGQAGSSVYSATKFALRGFCQGLRADLHGTGVGVSCIMPGFVRDAGMYADSGVELPRGVGTSSPQQVADAVVEAIVDDRGEIVVAPLAMRAGAVFAGLSPTLAAAVARKAGGQAVGDDFATGQSDKRL